MKFTHILFDLDGTIVESGPGIISSARYALKTLGHNPDDFDYDGIIGPPLMDSFQHKYGFTHDIAVQAVHNYREYYIKKGMYESKLYSGIDTVLRTLAENGHTLLLATSKVEEQAIKVLNHFELAKYFTFIGGAASDHTRNTKTAVIEHVLQNCPVPLQTAIMVGDRNHDISGAHNVGLPCAAVLYGYGSRQEAEQAKAEYIVKSVEELSQLLQS